MRKSCHAAHISMRLVRKMNKENKKKRKTNDKNIHTAERKLSVGSVHEESYKRELERFFRHNLPKYRSK